MKERIKEGFRLRHSTAWRRTVDTSYAWDTWFNGGWFEDLCNQDPELKEAAKTGENVEEAIRNVFKRKYLAGVMKNFSGVLPDLTKYFAAKSEMDEFKKDRIPEESESNEDVQL